MRLLVLATLIAATGCIESEGDDWLAGGAATVHDRSSHAFGWPAPNLTDAELDRHLEGDVVFEATFVTAPATVNAGLGPQFNNTSCANCHVRDGRGLPRVADDGGGSQLRITVTSATEGESRLPGGPSLVPGFGLQLQDHATHGYVPETAVAIEWIEVPGEYADGEPYSLRWPLLDITTADGERFPQFIPRSPRIPPPVFGLGLLEAVPDDRILSRVDPRDLDGDGVSGRVNTVWDAVRQEPVVGRFGWKANFPHLLQTCASDFSEDMGVSSPLFPEPSGDSEIDAETLELVTFYVQTLGVPARAQTDDPQVQRGHELFRAIGCADCHVETLRTGDHPVAALAHQTIHPYTNLLLHDVGPGLADYRHEYDAWDTEWRTQPLWGIGVTETVMPYAGYLHDGRARTLAEAILWHGGEALASSAAFRTMPAGDRAALLAFLRSL